MSVQVNEDPFSDESINRFLCGETSAEQSALIESRMDSCEDFARRVTQLVAQPWDWGEVTSNLVDDEFDDRRDLSSTAAGAPAPNCQSERADSLLQRELSGWLDPTDDPNMLGRFAGYEIVGVVGHGGMGIVLKGFERALNRFVAIKVLAPRLAGNGAARKRFEREARAAAAVLHDNVIAIHRVDQWHGLPFLVMPYVGGDSLQQRIDREGPLDLEATLRIAQQIAAGLAAAHAQGLVHRDIKPANILLDQGVERVTITDFGLARAADDAPITRTGFVNGTPMYMSPEQAAAQPFDHRSDLFSLGSVMYSMATGVPPFQADENQSLLGKIRNEPATDVREKQETVPEWLAELIDWCHAKSPADRPHSAQEIERYLGEWLARLKQPQRIPTPTRPAIPQSAKRDRRPPSRWNRKVLAALGGFLFMLAGIFITLETSKGTITIESEVDDVPIVIKKDGKVYDKLTINRDGKSIRVYAGEYELSFDGEPKAIEIDNSMIALSWGDDSVVRIREKRVPNEEPSTPALLSLGPTPLEAKIREATSQFVKALQKGEFDDAARTLSSEGRSKEDRLPELAKLVAEISPQSARIKVDEESALAALSAVDLESPHADVGRRPQPVLQFVREGELWRIRDFDLWKSSDLSEMFEQAPPQIAHENGHADFNGSDEAIVRKLENTLTTQHSDNMGAHSTIQLTTWNDVKQQVASMVIERERMAHGDVEFRSVTEKGGIRSERHYHVWFNGLNRRADWRDFSGDEGEHGSQVITPTEIWSIDHQDSSKSQSRPLASNDVSRWDGVIDVRMIGFVNRWVEALDSSYFYDDLLPKGFSNPRVEIRQHNGGPQLTVVRLDRRADRIVDGWVEFWLSPKHGNRPIYMAGGWTVKDNPNEKYVLKQHTQWKRIDGVWFPTSVKWRRQCEHLHIDETTRFELISASFSEPPPVELFQPHQVGAPQEQPSSSFSKLPSTDQDLPPKSEINKGVSDDRKTLFVRLLGDKLLFVADPNQDDSKLQPDPDGREQGIRSFSSDGFQLQFSLELPGKEACFHIVDSNHKSIRVVVRLECSEFLPDKIWERIDDQPIALNVPYDDFQKVHDYSFYVDRVVYLPAKDGSNSLQTTTYEGQSRTVDVVEDTRKDGGQPLVSIRLDPPTAADKVATSHRRIGPNFTSGHSSSDYFDRCSDEELLRALQGRWTPIQFDYAGDAPEEYPRSAQDKPVNLVFDETAFHWNSFDKESNAPHRETFSLELKGPGMPRSFNLVGNESFGDMLLGNLELTPDGNLTFGMGRAPAWKFETAGHFQIKARRSEDSKKTNSNADSRQEPTGQIHSNSADPSFKDVHGGDTPEYPVQGETVQILVHDDDADKQEYEAGDRIDVYVLKSEQDAHSANSKPALENVAVVSCFRFDVKRDSRQANWAGQSIVVKAPADSVLRTPGNELLQDLYRQGKLRFYVCLHDDAKANGKTDEQAASTVQLKTWNDVKQHVASMVIQREQMAHGDVEFKSVTKKGDIRRERHYHVWFNGLNRRADSRDPASDNGDYFSHIMGFGNWLINHRNGSKAVNLNTRIGPHQWEDIIDVRKFGFVNLPANSVDDADRNFGLGNLPLNSVNDADLYDDLLPKGYSNPRVELREHIDGQVITVVKLDRKIDRGVHAWSEYWLSPKVGNFPIYMAGGWTDKERRDEKHVVKQRTQWKRFDGIWFPTSIKHHRLCEHLNIDETAQFELIAASFAQPPAREIFDVSRIAAPKELSMQTMLEPEIASRGQAETSGSDHQRDTTKVFDSPCQLQVQVVFVADAAHQLLDEVDGLRAEEVRERVELARFVQEAFADPPTTINGTRQVTKNLSSAAVSEMLSRLVDRQLIEIGTPVMVETNMTTFAPIALGSLRPKDTSPQNMQLQIQCKNVKDGRQGFRLQVPKEPEPGEDLPAVPETIGSVIRIQVDETAIAPWYFHWLNSENREQFRKRVGGEQFLLFRSSETEDRRDKSRLLSN